MGEEYLEPEEIDLRGLAAGSRVVDRRLQPAIDHTGIELEDVVFESCEFVGFDFTGSDLSDVTFADCSFHSVRLDRASVRRCFIFGSELVDSSMAVTDFSATLLSGVSFRGCKAVGVAWHHADYPDEARAAVSFVRSDLSRSTFLGLQLEQLVVTGCRLVDVDFSGAVLTGTTFDDCDLSGAFFEETTLFDCDLRTARHFRIDPRANRLNGLVIAPDAVEGILEPIGITIQGHP